MVLPSFLTGQLWKLATGAAAIVTVIVIALLIASGVQNRSLTTQRNDLSARINDPKTGFIVQLAQARTNVAQLQRTITVQNQAIDRITAEGQARLRDTQQKLDVALAERSRLERKLTGFLATKPQGATLEDRVRDIDDRALKEFLP